MICLSYRFVEFEFFIYGRKIRARILVPANPPFPLHLQPCASRFAARSKLWHAFGGNVDFSSASVIPSLVLYGVAAIKFMADLGN
ncbi:unnamed protein product [Malus baccata var. baccata]